MNNIIDLEPACKRSPSLNEKKRTVSYGFNHLTDVQRAVLDAASLRNDEVHQLLSPLREEILNLQ